MLSGAVYAYQSQYDGKAYFGTEVMGEDVSGKTKKEIAVIVTDKISAYNLNFKIGDEEYVASSEEIGVLFDSVETTQEVIDQGKTSGSFMKFINSGYSLLYRISPKYANEVNSRFQNRFKRNVEIKYEIDDKKLNAFTRKISEKYSSDSKNAGLVMKGTDVQVIPAIYGQEIVADSLRLQIENAIKAGRTRGIVISTEEVSPEIIEDSTKKSINLAQRMLAQSVTYSHEGKTYAPTKATRGGWIIFKEYKGSLVPKIDESKVRSYLTSVSKNINVAPVNQKVKIINGKEREVTRRGKKGLAVNVSLAAKKTAIKMNEYSDIKLELPTYIVDYKTEVNNVLVADWDKYIEVDILSQRMCAYLAGGQKVNCWAVTTGKSGWNTPTGTFLVRSKAGAGGRPGSYGGGVCMPNPPSTEKLCGINYVTNFTGQGHAIHEAWWRTYSSYNRFGNSGYLWNGSHGCVNAAYDVAKFIYYWAPIGTPIVIHY